MVDDHHNIDRLSSPDCVDMFNSCRRRAPSTLISGDRTSDRELANLFRRFARHIHYFVSPSLVTARIRLDSRGRLLQSHYHWNRNEQISLQAENGRQKSFYWGLSGSVVRWWSESERRFRSMAPSSRLAAGISP